MTEVISTVDTFISNQGFAIFVAVFLLFSYDRKINKILNVLDKLSLTLEVYIRKSGPKDV